MTLVSGTRLGSYEIVAPLGAGGMGEVFRAKDTKLGREVALKVLPAHLASDSERLARFQREAQVLASLNHPNIAAIYGVEEAGNVRALVMELVEGPTLTDRIAQGPIPVDEAMPLARQIAEALESAHDNSIVHRDLKPANVKVRPDGTVKVLDFGLAKLGEIGSGVSSAISMSPTITSPAMTMAGVILGTAAYMSPEQARGKAVDRRADIWAFGCVLFEMLTGRRAFEDSDTISDVIAAILKNDPDWSLLPPDVPAGVRTLLRRCLQKDAKNRLPHIGLVRFELEDTGDRPATEVKAERPTTPRRANVAWAAAVALLATSTGIALWSPWRSVPERTLVRLDVDLGADVALPANTQRPNVVLSPDGSRLLYIASVAGGPSRLFVRRLSEDDTVALSGTDGVVAAAFSPDSNSVAFVIENRVYTIPSDGGAVHRIADTERPYSNVAWDDAGGIVVSGALQSGSWRIPAVGGAAVKLTELAQSEAIHAHASMLPGAKGVLFVTGGATSDAPAIEAVSMTGGEPKVLIRDGVSPVFLPTGHLLFLRQSTLYAVRFDPDRLEVFGDPIPIVSGVKTTMAGQIPVGTFSVGGDGTLVYRRETNTAAPAAPVGTMRVDVIDTKGVRTPFISTPGDYRHIRFSPDGSQLAMTVSGAQGGRGGSNVFVYSRQREGLAQVTFDGGIEPAWTRPDGRHLLFGRDGIYWTRPGGQPQRLASPPTTLVWSLAPDGKRIAGGANANGGLLFTAPLVEEGDVLKLGPREPFSPPQLNEFEAEFSPDGRWIAFATDRSGRFEVMVRAFPPPASGQAYPISNSGGREPRWSRTAPELLYVEGQRLMAVSYTAKGDVFEAQRPSVRVERFGTGEWDVAPDGRIAVVTPIPGDPKATPPAPQADHTVVFLQNFADEVRRRVK